MPDDKKEGSVFGQVAAGILIALIAGGTSPWWWDKFFWSASQSPEASQRSNSSQSSPSPSSISPPTPMPAESSDVLTSPSTDVSNQSRGITPIQWFDSVSSLGISQSIGLKFTFRCPSSGEQSDHLWGTDIYTGGSSICEAAVHSGVINRDQGGAVTIEVRGSRQSFLGSQRFGVLSKGYNSYGTSFAIIP